MLCIVHFCLPISLHIRNVRSTSRMRKKRMKKKYSNLYVVTYKNARTIY